MMGLELGQAVLDDLLEEPAFDQLLVVLADMIADADDDLIPENLELFCFHDITYDGCDEY